MRISLTLNPKSGTQDDRANRASPVAPPPPATWAPGRSRQQSSVSAQVSGYGFWVWGLGFRV